MQTTVSACSASTRTIFSHCRFVSSRLNHAMLPMAIVSQCNISCCCRCLCKCVRVQMQAHTNGQFAQRRPFSSKGVQHSSQRQGTPVASRTTKQRHAKRCQTAAAANLHDMISDAKHHIQKQKTAAVLGALGVVASGMTVVGMHPCRSADCAAPAIHHAVLTTHMYFHRPWTCSRLCQNRNMFAWQLSGERLMLCRPM